MRGNSNRSLRLAFDSAVERYDAGRPAFGPELLAELVAMADLHGGDRVLEVGAGTGQLTGGLLDQGLTVIAVEPGANMAAFLRAKFAGRSALRVEESLFEDCNFPDESFAAVLSANAFHWVDPAVSYHKAARLLKHAGSLGLIWTFPILADSDLQHRLNDEAFVGDLADFRREPEGYLTSLQTLLAEGRAELTGSGAFIEPTWVMNTQLLEWTIDDYIAFLASMSNGVAAVDKINDRVSQVLTGIDNIAIANHVYVGVAKKLPSMPRI